MNRVRASGTRISEEVKPMKNSTKKGRARLEGRARVAVIVAALGCVTAALYTLAALFQLAVASGVHL